MSQDANFSGNSDANRRDFIKGASLGGLMLMMGGVPIQAAETAAAETPKDTGYSSAAAPVSCAVIGCGIWGLEIIQTLGLLPNGPVVAVCDTYKASLNKAKNLAPKAEAFDDYKKVLELASVQAVIIATPTHLHKEIVLAALQAGKHVYCEAPIAHTIEDARAIARAAQGAVKLNFQSGLQFRSEPLKHHVQSFMRNGAVGTSFLMRSQWHQKTSWRRASPNPEREKALNWRLDSSLSLGLAGEAGIHQIDLANWFLGKKPVAINGFGAIVNWDDGRTVPDTIQALVQYPDKANFFYDATLANSYQNAYDIVFGNKAAITMGQNELGESAAWWFKEADADVFGWEIYAKTKEFEQFRKETGISLSADASHSVQAAKAAAPSPYSLSTLHYALIAFLKNSHLVSQGVTDFTATYGTDADGLKESLAAIPKAHAAGFMEGYEATVTAIQVNQAVTGGGKLEVKPELFDLG